MYTGIFLSLLEAQLAIIIKSTNTTHAAIYISTNNDYDTNTGYNDEIQLVCTYPNSNNYGLENEDNDNDDKIHSGNENDTWDDHTSDIFENDTKYIGYNTNDYIEPKMYPIQYQGVDLGVLQTLSKTNKYQTDFDWEPYSRFSSWNPYSSKLNNCPICEAISTSLGASIALEMTRLSSIDEVRSMRKKFFEREDNLWLTSSSALLTSKTLLKMLSKRLQKGDDIGQEMIKNVIEQNDSIYSAMLALTSDNGKW